MLMNALHRCGQCLHGEQQVNILADSESAWERDTSLVRGHASGYLCCTRREQTSRKNNIRLS